MPYKDLDKRRAKDKKWRSFPANKEKRRRYAAQLRASPGYMAKYKELYLHKKASETIKKEKTSASTRKKIYNKNNPLKYKARYSVQNAVVKGILIRPIKCSLCAFLGRIEAHHEDYSKPLEVVWLCKKCHRIADQSMVK